MYNNQKNIAYRSRVCSDVIQPCTIVFTGDFCFLLIKHFRFTLLMVASRVFLLCARFLVNWH